MTKRGESNTPSTPGGPSREQVAERYKEEKESEDDDHSDSSSSSDSDGGDFSAADDAGWTDIADDDD